MTGRLSLMLVLLAGCVEPGGPVSTASLAQGHVASFGPGLIYATADDGTHATAQLRDPLTTTVIASSSLTDDPQVPGRVIIGDAAPYDFSEVPSAADLAIFDQFAADHGAELVTLIGELRAQQAIDPQDPAARRRYAALVQVAQALVLARRETLAGLDALLVEVAELPESAAPYTDSLARTRVETLDGEQLFWLPLVPGVLPFWGGGPPAPVPEMPNAWLCQGTPYQAGCRGICGRSCDDASKSTRTRCADGVLFLDTLYTGITNVCCRLHDAGYDLCSALFNCGVGQCTVTVKTRWGTVRVRVPCWTLVEACRRGPDLGCAACAIANGYQPADCLLWAVGLGPGTPVTYVDSKVIGKCCPRCGTLSPAPSGSWLQQVDCVCDATD